ncbi:hypothetical protein FRC03_010878 [Tulasnella sp. 419]|nr:hypothetical protein FRC03_010878 [Tulasnella sp. 419]
MSSVQPPSSNASTLYAQPSKNWVIPPRPKPGRKPKKPVVEESGGEGETDEVKYSDFSLSHDPHTLHPFLIVVQQEQEQGGATCLPRAKAGSTSNSSSSHTAI